MPEWHPRRHLRQPRKSRSSAYPAGQDAAGGLGWLIHGFRYSRGRRNNRSTGPELDLNLGFTDSDDRQTVAANVTFITVASVGKEILGLVTPAESIVVDLESLARHSGKRDCLRCSRAMDWMTDEPGCYSASRQQMHTLSGCGPEAAGMSRPFMRVARTLAASWKTE